MSWCPAWSRSRKPEAMLRNGVIVLDRIKSRSKCPPSPSLPPPPPPLNPRRPKKPRHFPILGLKRGFTRVGVNFQYSFVLSIIDVDLRVVCIAMWMTKHEQKPWQESRKNVCLKTAVLVCNARNLLGVAFHRQFSRPHIEAGNRSTRTQSQGVRLFLQGKSTQRCLTMIKHTTLTTALWRLLLHTCHFLDYLLNNNSRRKNSIWWKCKRSIRGSGQLHLFAVTCVGTRKFKPNHWYQMEVFSLFPPQNKI